MNNIWKKIDILWKSPKNGLKRKEAQNAVYNTKKPDDNRET